MRKVFLDELPKWEKGEGAGRPGCINWSKSIGYNVRFIYDDIEGEIEIVGYDNKERKLKIQYDNKCFGIRNYDFANCKIGNAVGKKTNKFKIEIGERIKSENKDITIIGREYRNVKKYYKYICNICGYEGEKVEYSILDRSTCPCCTNQIVVEGINDIPTTNPELVKYFKSGYDEAKLYTKGSKKKVEVVCFKCGKVRLLPVNKIEEDLVCKKCVGKSVSETKNKIKIEDSFVMNDKNDRLKYWDCEKNKVSPYEVHKGSSKKFWFTCKNRHSFKASIISVNGKRATWCPHCASELYESKMASTLKQVLKHEFNNTVWEYDAGFRGKKGSPARYDIYIPELNLLIECQSKYHDDKKDFDTAKREFAIGKGFEYLEIDCRDFNPINAIKLFFPHLNRVPKYVRYDKGSTCRFDLKEAQRLLDTTDLTQKQICEVLEVDLNYFADRVKKGDLIIPKNKRKTKSIVQLNLDGTFVRKYNKGSEFKKHGFSTSCICRCCKGIDRCHKNFIFMYEDDYNDFAEKYNDFSLDDIYKFKIDRHNINIA